ncbi:hypothetical protein J2Z60_001471 [Lactobacillus colini]|uniref:Uncharacterized protein n=1 Tax=Lactobacillus colini TaxID=1819254 RepID=A0ABS4MG05_9LACO|nr:hypothetical protein [Lactobacillus colini]MBP2058292.1 hypothetical protein [Lactobacillus colini]
MKKIKDEGIEKKDSQSIIRAFILLNILLLGFIVLDGSPFLKTKLPVNIVIMIIMIITFFIYV